MSRWGEIKAAVADLLGECEVFEHLIAVWCTNAALLHCKVQA